MKNNILFFLIFLQLNIYSQKNNRWVDFFSYLNVQQILTTPDQLVGKAENSFFTQNFQNNEIERFSSVKGFSGEPISQMFISQNLNKTFIIHNNGLIEIIDATKKIKKIPDLKFNSFINNDQKKCHKIFAQGDLLYLAMGYGISVFNLANDEFEDTYYIGIGGTPVSTFDIIIASQNIYAATAQGLKKADISSNLIDFNNWTTLDNSSWKHLFLSNNKLYATKTTDVYEIANGIPVFKRDFSAPLLDVQVRDNISFTTENEIILTDENLSDIVSFNSAGFSNFKANTAIDYQNKLYIGTKAQGIIEINLSNNNYRKIAPDGPAYNDPFGLDVLDGQVWVVYGKHSPSFNPYSPSIIKKSISHFNGSSWKNIPYEDFQIPNLCYVQINPSAPNQVFISSAIKGLLKIENENQFTLYDDTNSTLQSFIIGNHKETRVFAIKFDAENNLWITQTNENANNDNIKVLRNSGNWDLINIPGIFTSTSPFADGVKAMDFDENGILWMGTMYKGVVGMDTETGQNVSLNQGFVSPSYTAITGLSIDRNDQLWAGNYSGLRVLSNLSSAFQNPNNVVLKPIKIEFQGSVQLLLEGQEISVIKTDGSNNKWIGTVSAGLFYVSEDGKKTIYHFTTENSPLPSNEIYDLAIDGKSGMVYIATGKGLIGFKGNATDAVEEMNDVYAFPNPVNLKNHNLVTIRGLQKDIQVKIIDVEGNLVYETRSKGGSVDWDLTAFGRYQVASGVYIVLLTNDDGTQTQTTKILVIK